MPLLAGLFKSILYAFAGFFGSFISKRLAIGAAVMALFLGIAATFFAAITGLASALLTSMPPFMARAVCWFWPDNGTFVISSVLAAHAARWAYDVNSRYLQYTANWSK